MNNDSGDDPSPPPSSPDASEGREVLDAIRRLVRVVRRSAIAAEKRVGLSAAQLFILHKLADVPSLSLRALAERTLTTQSSASEVVQKLVTRGLVARVKSARDARSVDLSLTDQGREVIARAPAAVQDEIIAGVHRMNSRERRQLAKLLGRLLEEIGAADMPAGMLLEDPPTA